MKWYLAGPICHVVDGSDRTWREEAKVQIDCIDPFDEEEKTVSVSLGEDPKTHMNWLRREGKIDEVRRKMQAVLKLDEDSVRKSGGLLVYTPTPSWGTIREVSIAHQQSKPVVVWTEVTGINLSNTLIALSTMIVGTLDEAISACRSLDRNEA